MEKGLEKWHDYIAANRAELMKQYESVRLKYPLVALALMVQRARSADRWVEEALVSGPLETAEPTWIQFQEAYRSRKRKRERCLGTAATPGDALQCLSSYPPI
jgi:hypothetical protein